MDKMIEMVRIANFDQIDKNKKGKKYFNQLGEWQWKSSFVRKNENQQLFSSSSENRLTTREQSFKLNWNKFWE